MGYDCPQPRGANHARKLHALSAADFKLKEARAASKPGFAGKERLLRMRRYLCGKVMTVIKQMHRVSAAANGFREAKAASAHPPMRKGRLVTQKRQLPGSASALAQRKRLMIAKANELKKRQKAVAQARLTKARHQGGQGKAIRSSNVTADQNLAPTGHNVEASAPYTIKSSPGKGLGMFTTKDIAKGTRILAEKPFFSLTEEAVVSESDPYAPNDVSKAFDRLPASEKLKYLGLHCPERPGCSLILSIYEANCFEMGSGTCIYLDASRINHSCMPNAYYSWNSSIERVTLHAVKDIAEGEEITISYCSAYHTLEERKHELEPQVRRQQMLNLNEEIADYQHDPPSARAEYGHRDEQSAILRLINLIDEEGLIYEKSLVYHDAAECALKRGSRKNALEYASKELDVDLCCVGRDSPSYTETINFFLKVYFGAEEVFD
ncbi:MAG: hypothetical protein Q9161_001403 [Pseudevernia consocians]